MTNTLFSPASGAVLRAPLLPVERYSGLALGERPDDPDVREALEVASPVLAASLDRPPRDARRAGARDSSVLRYLIRMSTRPTPFGLFAGVGLVRWGTATDARLAAGPRPVRVRPDMGWLIGFALDRERELDAHGAVGRVVASGCLVERDGRLVLADPSTGGRPGPEVSVRATAAVRAVLSRARSAVPVTTLVDDVTAARQASRDRVAGLVGELLRAGLLMSDLRPPLTSDPIAHVADRLTGVDPHGTRATELTGITDAARRAVTGGDRAAVAERLRALHPGDEVLQVDSGLVLSGATVCARIGADAARAADLLFRLHPAPGGPAHLAAYRAAVVARYGTDTAVPLLELLDPRNGLGPPARTGGAGQGGTGHGTADPAVTRRSERLREVALAALRDGRTEIELDDELCGSLTIRDPDPADVPDDVELSVFVAAASRSDLDRGDYRLVVGPNLGAQAAGRGLGRFADLLGDDAVLLLRELHAKRSGGPGVDAELVYLPGRHRSANVAVRPAVCTHEIPVGVSPGVPADRVIRPDQLHVMVRDGRLRLWWDAGGCEVRVHAGHMLNTGTAPALCRFLSEFGQDGLTPLSPFGWGAASGLPRLPRVHAGRVVLALARWRLPRARAREILSVADRTAEFGPALRRWRNDWRVPQLVYLGSGDNRLLLDLDDPTQADQIRRDLVADRGGDLVLHEALPGPGQAWLPGPDGRYLTELVVPLTRRPGRPRTDAARTVPRTAGPPVADADRVRRPGSDWLHLNLYGPADGQDEMIGGRLGELVDGHDGPWFFLRYRDPQPHLRVRLQGDPDTLTGEILPELTRRAARLVASGLLARFSVEVYDREVARYGGPQGLDVAERIFAADSAAVTQLLPATGPDRIALAVLGVDDLLDALGLDPATRLAWASEVAPPATVTAAPYRSRSGELRRLLSGDLPDAVRQALTGRRSAVRAAGHDLRRLHTDGTLTVDVPRLARSYAHLHCNRLGVDPAAERIVLGLLRRTRDSLRAAPAVRPPRGHDRR